MDSSLLPYFEVIGKMLHSGCTDEDISNHLTFECGLQRGASVANIRRFCKDNGLRRPDNELHAAVFKSIKQVGLTASPTMKFQVCMFYSSFVC